MNEIICVHSAVLPTFCGLVWMALRYWQCDYLCNLKWAAKDQSLVLWSVLNKIGCKTRVQNTKQVAPNPSPVPRRTRCRQHSDSRLVRTAYLLHTCCCLLLPAAACCCLLLPAAACCCLLLPAACCCLLLPAAACCCLLLPACCCLLLPAAPCCCLLLVLLQSSSFQSKKQTARHPFRNTSETAKHHLISCPKHSKGSPKKGLTSLLKPYYKIETLPLLLPLPLLCCLLLPAAACCCLPLPAPACCVLLAGAGWCWLLLAAAGCCWLLPAAACCCLLLPAAACCLLLPAACCWLLPAAACCCCCWLQKNSLP